MGILLVFILGNLLSAWAPGYGLLMTAVALLLGGVILAKRQAAATR
ncbi:MAG TPA: hypothetical protein VGM81_12440 [Burkholderiaceae bacterium]|jgi:predicted MFS family arabinose efflux permease